MKLFENFSHIIIYINYYLFKIIGLIPFKVVINMNRPLKFSYCKLSSYYSITLIALIMSVSHVSTIAVPKLVKQYDNSYITAIVFYVKAIMGVSALTGSWIIIWIKKYRAIECGNKFSRINDDTIGRSHLSAHNSISYRIVAIFSINICIWVSLLIIDYLEFRKMFGFSLVSLIIPSFVNSLCFIQYAFILMLMRIRFDNLNCAIMELTPTKIMLNFNNVSVLAKSSPSELILNNLARIKKNYNLLCEVLREITMIYSLPIFLMIMSSNYNIVCTMYYFMKLFIKPPSEWILATFISSFSYLAMEIFPIIILTTSVTEILNEMAATVDSIYFLMNEPIIDREVRIQLEAFSLELLHTDFNISACCMLPLDRTLLHSIVSMVTTYLIILLQYSSTQK